MKSIFKIFIIIFLVCSVNPFTFTGEAKNRIMKRAIELVYKEEKDFFNYTMEDTVIIIIENISDQVISIDGQIFNIKSQKECNENRYYTVEYWRPVSWYAYVAFRCTRSRRFHRDGQIFNNWEEGVAVYVVNIMGRWYPLLGKRWIPDIRCGGVRRVMYKRS